MIKLYFIIFLLLSCRINAREEFYINNIYIEATASNKHEAKVKAHDAGMRRAILLIADNLKLGQIEITKIPYAKLKNVFNLSSVKEENSSNYSYKAVINYAYNKYELNQLFLQYGDNSKYYKYLFIPILHQGDKIFLTDFQMPWFMGWKSLVGELEKSKILYNFNQLKPEITPGNIEKLQYEDFLRIFPNVIFERVLLVHGEYITDPHSHKLHIDIKADNIGVKEIISSYNSYNLNNIYDIIPIFKKALIDIFVSKNQEIKLSVPLSLPLMLFSERDFHEITMLAEIAEPEEILPIHNRLRIIMDDPNLKMIRVSNNYIKFIITTKLNDDELAEKFFHTGLSYHINEDGSYNLFSTKEGV